MNCKYESSKIKSWLDLLVMPLAIAFLGLIGTCSANKISANFNKASILKEFLPILMNGSPGEKEVARVALEPYLSSEEWIRVNSAAKEKIQTDLLKAVKDQNVDAASEAAISLKRLYPITYESLIEGKSENDNSPSRKLLEEKINSSPQTMEFFNSTVKNPAIRN